MGTLHSLDAMRARRVSPMHVDVVEPAKSPRGERYLTRQPVLDTECRVIGYELGVRGDVPMPVPDGVSTLDQARDDILLQAVADDRYRQLMSRKFTLLELGADSLDSAALATLPKENTILLMNMAVPEPGFVARCQALARQGYALALDAESVMPGMEPLLRECRYLRLDVAGQGLTALCDRLTRIGGMPGTRLIARNVETEEAFLACRKLGFDLYQGYFFTLATPSKARKPDSKRLRVMNLINLVASQAEHAVIEAEFKYDPGLTYKLLRFINSPAVGLRYPVRSIAHALLMLGSEPLHRWLLLLLFVHQDGDGRQRALLRHALIRARFMERLGVEAGTPGLQGGLFIVGILSMLDALLNATRDEALAPLRLAPEITTALARGEGPLAPYLLLAEACEQRDADNLRACAHALGLSPDIVNSAHVEALMWAEGIDI